MDFTKEFDRLMQEQNEIALATSVENRPNVRIVNFWYDSNQKGVLYFSTFCHNQKLDEFLKNNMVAFTTIPYEGNQHIRVTHGIVQKSNLTVYDLKQHFVAKIPDYERIITEAGDFLVLYEIHFSKADVTIDFENSGSIDL